MVHDKIKDVVKDIVGKVNASTDPDSALQGYTDIENNSNKKSLTDIVLWALGFMVADMVLFIFMDTWSAPVVIGFLQIIILLIIGVGGELTDFSKLFNGAVALFGRKENEPKK